MDYSTKMTFLHAAHDFVVTPGVKTYNAMLTAAQDYYSANAPKASTPAPARNTEPGTYTFLEAVVPAVRDPYAEHLARVAALTAYYRARCAAERMAGI